MRGSRHDQNNSLWADKWNRGGNLYLKHFAEAGFRSIPQNELQPGDVVLMQIHADVLNHGAIYLAGDVLLHHLMGRLSSREVYGGYYRKHSTHWLQYGGAGC